MKLIEALDNSRFAKSNHVNPANYLGETELQMLSMTWLKSFH